MLTQRIGSRLQRQKLSALLGKRINGRLKAAALLFGGMVLATLATYLAYVAPAAARLAEREHAYAELRRRHAEALLFQKQKKAFEGVRAGIPTQKDMPLLVKDLVLKARALRLSVAAINLDNPKRAGSGLTMLSFSFPADGSYPDIKRFIHEIETSGRLIGIQDMKLDASEKGRVELQMKLVAYIREE